MTMFADPRNPGVLPPIDWDKLASDDDRQEIANLFRSRYEEHRLNKISSKPFDAVAEEAKIPQVVRDWEKAQMPPALMFTHPVSGVDMNWSTLPRAAKMVVVDAYAAQQEGGMPTPPFVVTWAAKNRDKEMERLMADTRQFEDVEQESGRSLDYHRTIVKSCSERSIEISKKTHQLLSTITEKGRDNAELGRRTLYKLMLENNTHYQSAKQHFTVLRSHEAEIENRMKQAENENRKQMWIRHEEEKKLLDQRWSQVHADFKKLTDERVEPVTKSYAEMTDRRGGVMRTLFHLREDAIVPNVGINVVTGSIRQQISAGTFLLSAKQIKYVREEIFPLLHSAAKKHPKGIVIVTGDNEKMAQKFLADHLGDDSIRQLDIYRLNWLLDVYKIPKPSEYVKEVGWLGDGNANFHEYFIRERQLQEEETRNKTQKMLAEQQARLTLQQQLTSVPPAPTQTTPAPAPAQTNPKEEDANTNSRDSSSSSSSSASASPSSPSAPEPAAVEA